MKKGQKDNMTSLEFIEKEIKAVEKELAEIVDITNDYLEIPDTYENKYNLIDDANERYSNYSLRLSKLIQIKTILETWYSIKQGIKLCEGKVYEDSYYEYLQFKEELFDESESEEAGERLKPIKKALEVEDES